MKISISGTYTRNEVTAMENIAKKINSFMDCMAVEEMMDVNFTMKASGTLSKLLYKSHLKDELEITIELELGEEYLIRLTNNVGEFIDILEPFKALFKTNIGRLLNVGKEFQSIHDDYLEPLSKTTRTDVE